MKVSILTKAFVILMVAFTGQAVAYDALTYKCIMHRHIILEDDEVTEGKLDTFEMREEFDELYLGGWYFGGALLPLETVADNYAEAKDDEGKTFIYWAGRFHFTFISHRHVTSISGDCKPVPRMNKG